MSTNAKKTVMIVQQDGLIEEMFLKRDYETTFPYDPDHLTPDLLVFTGGEDVNPALYGEKPHVSTRFNEKRDRYERQVWTDYKDVCKVGVCRGGQFLNVMNGGEMWQDVDKHGVSKGHDLVSLVDLGGTKFHRDYVLNVTSTHHQMMVPAPKGIVLGVAYEATKFITTKGRAKPEYDTEIVYYPESSSLCFQPHPEYRPKDSELQEYFFALLNDFLGV